MKNSEILAKVDHSMLNADASWDEIKRLCEEAVRYGTASACVPPSYTARAAAEFPGLNICTVIGFPLGYNDASAKVREVEAAISGGASEVDTVINLGDVKNREFDKITDEISALKKAAGDKILKVIIETCYLTDDEKIELCRCVTDGGADYIKTSTGFGKAGATIEDVRLLKRHVGPGVKVKAAGGIRTREDMLRFIEAGCERLGTSAAIKILSGEQQLEAAHNQLEAAHNQLEAGHNTRSEPCANIGFSHASEDAY